MEKNCLQENDDRKFLFAGTYMLKKNCLQPCHLKPGTHDHKNSTNTGYATLSQPHFACTSDEVKCVISHVNPALFTETWLRDSVIENHLDISGYHLTARNRTTGPHDGVGLYIKNNPRFKSLEYLQDPDFETMWTWLQPTRLPRGITCRIAGTVND